jgi:hypothetical protein
MTKHGEHDIACVLVVDQSKSELAGLILLVVQMAIGRVVERLSSEMADRQFWGVVNHRSGSDARLQSEPCQPWVEIRSEPSVKI